MFFVVNRFFKLPPTSYLRNKYTTFVNIKYITFVNRFLSSDKIISKTLYVYILYNAYHFSFTNVYHYQPTQIRYDHNSLTSYRPRQYSPPQEFGKAIRPSLSSLFSHAGLLRRTFIQIAIVDIVDKSLISRPASIATWSRVLLSRWSGHEKHPISSPTCSGTGFFCPLYVFSYNS